MSENANIVANAIATYLVEHGALSLGDQLFAMRCEYARPWRSKLVRHGFDACYEMPVLDIAAGVDLALSRLLDEAQVEYDARGEAT